MTRRSTICKFISRAAISIALTIVGTPAVLAQGFLKYEPDSIPFFRGFALSADLVGLAQMQLGDYGQYEAALRLNLHDQYFPIVEVGYGKASSEAVDVPFNTYKTEAPYFRLGIDVNIMKKKHTGNRIYAGLRYAYTNYRVDFYSQPFKDPVWEDYTAFSVRDERCHQHWAEALFGIDAKVAGPLHLGWSVRYRIRMMHQDGQMGKTWYVPGYGIQDTSRLGATFNVIIDI